MARKREGGRAAAGGQLAAGGEGGILAGLGKGARALALVLVLALALFPLTACSSLVQLDDDEASSTAETGSAAEDAEDDTSDASESEAESEPGTGAAATDESVVEAEVDEGVAATESDGPDAADEAATSQTGDAAADAATGSEDDASTDASAGDADSPDASQFFEQVSGSYIFTSGAGAWSTQLVVEADGSFSGCYSDWNAVSDEGYSNGETYLCNFSGTFADPVQVVEGVYTVQIAQLVTEGEEGEEYVEDDMLYITSSPYGLDETDEVTFYLPGAVLSDMSESTAELIASYGSLLVGEGYEEDGVLAVCMICNEAQEAVFCETEA